MLKLDRYYEALIRRRFSLSVLEVVRVVYLKIGNITK
jgi:hypothetical protein